MEVFREAREIFLVDEKRGTPVGETLILAHGAGAPMDSPWMETLVAGLARRGLRVVRFEFPYMAGRRQTGGRRPPDAPAILIEHFLSVVRGFGGSREVFIGGKSMGARIASLVADSLGVRGLVCLGYPFRPPGKSPAGRIEHLKTLKTRTLIVQGTRDVFGGPREIAGYALGEGIRMRWIEGGDHDFRPLVRSGRSWEGCMEEACLAVGSFMSQEGH